MSAKIVEIRRKAAKELMSEAAAFLQEKAVDDSLVSSTMLETIVNTPTPQADLDKCKRHIKLQVQRAENREIQKLQEQCKEVVENKPSAKDILDPASAVIQNNAPPPEPPKSDPGPVRGRCRRRRPGRPYQQ